MASLIRIGICRLATPKCSQPLLLMKKEKYFMRHISSKLQRSQDPDRPPRPKPWNYKQKGFNRLTYLYDSTRARFDENSKIIVVEGPVAAGKSKFAKELAEELDMLYLPEANLDMVYINQYGYDLRQLDDQLPESCKSFDINNFLRTPKHVNTAAFQIRQYQVKVSQYIDALAHLLSTGQGLVLDRCCFSDFVFLEAMVAHGYVSKAAQKLYYEIRDNTIVELLRPHLVIYLDVPVSKVQENIKQRNLSCETKSSVLSPQYLGVMERFYKQHYLKEINNHSELLIYDWSEGGEVEIVVEDIQRINFDFRDQMDTKMRDWIQDYDDDWGYLRHKYADDKEDVMSYFNVPMYHVPELVVDAEDAKIEYDVLQQAPGETYEYGFNSLMGDSGLLFKMKGIHRETLALRERNLK